MKKMVVRPSVLYQFRGLFILFLSKRKFIFNKNWLLLLKNDMHFILSVLLEDYTLMPANSG